MVKNNQIAKQVRVEISKSQKLEGGYPMKTRILALLLAVCLILATFTGCKTTEAAPGETTSGTEVSADPIKIGAITSLSGALQDYGEQFQKGFDIGIEYATGGTNTVAGRPIEVIWEDTTTTPDVAKERTLKLLDTDKVDIIAGFASSSDAGACLDLAEEYETVMVIDPAAADSLTGDLWNEYIFRTGRNSAMDAEAVAAVMMGEFPEGTIGILAPDTSYGHSCAEPVKLAVEKRGGTVIAEEFPPADATDFTPYILRIKEAQPDYLFVVWAGANHPWTQLGESNLIEEGMQISTHLAEFAALKIMDPMVGMHGFTVYHNTLPDNDVNDFLVEKHLEYHGTLPDLFTQGGTSAAMAVITALEKSKGDASAETLIPLMEGMEFESPTGTRFFRAEDHQAMQTLYDVTLGEREADTDYPVPQLVGVIPWEEVAPPITNGRG